MRQVPPTHRGDAIGPGRGVEAEQSGADAKAEGRDGTAPEVGQDDANPRDAVRRADDLDGGVARQVMDELAHHDDVRAPGPEGQCAGAAHHAGKPALPRECGRHPAALKPDAGEPHASAGRPGRGTAGQVAHAGPHIQQRQRRAVGTPGNQLRQAEVHRGGAPEPPVRPGQVAERFGDDRRIGAGVVQQLVTDR